jgi:carbamoyl-phosphate synthase small subunit
VARAEGVPAVQGIDTRTLTRKLREHGTMRAGCSTTRRRRRRAKRRADAVRHADAVVDSHLREPVTYEGGELRVLLVDTGCKDNIARSLVKRAAPR